MNKFIKDKKIILLLIFIIFFTIKINFFRNLVEVISSPHNKRITQTYGHCGNESVGFLIYLKNKYNILDNPKIINYKHTAGNKWAIVNTNNINNHSNKIILLNHPGDEFKVSLSKISDQLYELKDLDFLSNKFLSIIDLEISNENLVNTNIKMLLEIYTVDIYNTKKTIKILDINDLKTSLQISINEFDKGNKLFFKIKDLVKKNDNFDFSFLLKLKNKYNLKDYKIIEKNSNCYYIK
jgi:hypothetical protein